LHPTLSPEDLKPSIKKTIQIVTSLEDAKDEYAALHFCLAPGELGIGSYLLLGLSQGRIPHMRLRDILMVQQDSLQDSTAGPRAWYPPPFLASPNQATCTGTEEVSTTREVAALLKFIYQPAVQSGKRATELFWVTSTLTQHPVDDTLSRYKAQETEASLFVSIDVLDNHILIRYAALEGHTAVATRGLLVVVTGAIHHLAHIAEDAGFILDPTTLEDLTESFSFSEIKNKSMAAKLCTVLCDTVSDKATLLELGGVNLPLERHTIFVTFTPTLDDTTRTALPKELRLALIHHKKYFFKGSLTL
jgi:hypothetical protein